MKSIIGLALFLFSSVLLASTPLVDFKWIEENPNAILLDIRPVEAYIAGHIPLSISSPYKDDWRVPVDGVPGMLPKPAMLEKKIAHLGVNTNDHVVIVVDGSLANDYGLATRVYWTFKVLGHNNISILNGGFAEYVDANKNIATNITTLEKGNFFAVPNTDYLVDSYTLSVELESWQTIDARSQAYFKGQKKYNHARVPGTIPGSLNFPHGRAFTQNSYARFADESLLVKETLAAKVNIEAAQTAVFCNTGQVGSTIWFVLSELLKIPNVALYDASMAGWTADKERAVQNPYKNSK